MMAEKNNDDIQGLFNDYEPNTLKIEDVQEGSAEFELIQKMGEELQSEYGLDAGAAQRMALFGYNESGGQIESAKEVPEYTGLTDMTNAIREHIKTVYLEAGLETPNMERIDMTKSFMASLGGSGFTTIGGSSGGDPNNPFDFIDNL